MTQQKAIKLDRIGELERKFNANQLLDWTWKIVITIIIILRII